MFCSQSIWGGLKGGVGPWHGGGGGVCEWGREGGCRGRSGGGVRGGGEVGTSRFRLIWSWRLESMHTFIVPCPTLLSKWWNALSKFPISYPAISKKNLQTDVVLSGDKVFSLYAYTKKIKMQDFGKITGQRCRSEMPVCADMITSITTCSHGPPGYSVITLEYWRVMWWLSDATLGSIDVRWIEKSDKFELFLSQKKLKSLGFFLPSNLCKELPKTLFQSPFPTHLFFWNLKVNVSTVSSFTGPSMAISVGSCFALTTSYSATPKREIWRRACPSKRYDTSLLESRRRVFDPGGFFFDDWFFKTVLTMSFLGKKSLRPEGGHVQAGGMNHRSCCRRVFDWPSGFHFWNLILPYSLKLVSSFCQQYFLAKYLNQTNQQTEQKYNSKPTTTNTAPKGKIPKCCCLMLGIKLRSTEIRLNEDNNDKF